MRLFFGINFDEKLKERFRNVIEVMKEDIIKGRLINPENIHMTLVFLGEVEEEMVIKLNNILDNINIQAFNINLSNLGTFPKKDGDILWIGIDDNPILEEVVKKLTTQLKDLGFTIENRPYTPHITIGRKIRLKEGISNLNIDETFKVKSIHLMELKSIDGSIRYVSIYERELQP